MPTQRRRSSVLSEEQQNYLNRRLQLRPAADKLQNVIPNSGVAAGIQGAMKRLEASINRDRVGHLLEARPGAEQLVKAGISQTLNLSSRIQRTAKQLERNITKDNLGHALETRPLIEDLQKQDITQDQRVAPALQATQKTLKNNLARANLYHALKYRPSVEQMVEKGFLDEDYVYQEESEEEDREFENAYLQYAASYYHQYGEYPHPDDFYEAYYGEETGQDDENYCSDEADYQQQVYQQQQQAAYDRAMEEHEMQQQAYFEEQERQRLEYEGEPESAPTYQRRSKNFHLTRILLKFVASMAEAGEINLEQKGVLKDLVVDQDLTILAVAETFDAESDLSDFKDSLFRLSQSR